MDSLAFAFTPATRIFFPLAFVLIAALTVRVPAKRRSLGAAGLLVLGSVAGLLLTAVLHHLGALPGSRAVKALQAAAYLSASAGAINTLALIAFDLILPRVRVVFSALAQDLVLAVAYALAALAVLSNAGANLSGLLATSAMVTAVMAFSLQDTLGNIIGGMVLQFEQSFSPGDWIRFGGDEGLVKEIRWRQTTLETSIGETVVIPNSALIKGTVTVLGARAGDSRQQWREVTFHVYYDRTPHDVIAAVEKAFRKDTPPFVAAIPPPICVLQELTGAAAVYMVRYFLTDLASCTIADSSVRIRVYYALARAGIKLSVPTRSVVVSQGSEQAQEQSRRTESQRRLEALRGVEMFSCLTDDELSILAQKLNTSPFACGELLTKQGDHAEWLFILSKGLAEIRLYSEDGSSYQTIATLQAGQFLGEMGLMTGEPRTATVVAATEVGCYRLDREGFQEVISRRPEIAEAISAILAKRRGELEAARSGLSEEAKRRKIEIAQSDLLSRIRSFFSLE
ncbi:MAG: mechanosensitive ion channel family protein [Elusimicrobiota bacterium]